MNTNPHGPGRSAQATLESTLGAAIAHIQAGDLDQAAALLQSAGGAALKNPVGRNIMGDIRLRQGRPREALREFDTAARILRNFPEAHCNRGVALQELGRLEEALAAEDRALALRPGYATAHFNRGNILKDLGRAGEAVAAYGRALAAQPVYPEALVNRGMALIRSGKAVDALSDFRRALALRQNYAAAQIGAASAYGALNQVSDALAEIDKVLATDPEYRDALLAKVGILREADRAEEALTIVDAMLARDPDDIVTRIERANSLAKLKRFDEALAASDAAIASAPKNSEAHLARGMALTQLGRYDEARAALDLAGRFGASGAKLERARAVALCGAGRLDDGLAAYDRAIADNPDDAGARYHRSFIFLAWGDYEMGWREHEWRLKTPGFNRPELLKVAPLWKGEDVTEKKVLLYSEQGAGDTIQFARYASLVAARGGRVSMVVHESLRRLFAANFPEMDVSNAIGMRAGFDYQAPLMSLPHIFGMRGEAEIPRDVPYLAADPERVAKWRSRLGHEGFKVGISWQGNAEYSSDQFRSIPLRRFASLASVPGVRLISVQAIHGLDQLQDLPKGMTVETLGEELVNNPDGFREMAAVIANLDLMIVSDSAPAHLAGALGRPVWLALAKQPDWRWLVGRSDSPWYPTMRLFHQREAGDWAGLFEEIAAALGEDVARKELT
jgi:tetratricopeptide (TPR) repeat protein